MGKIILEYLRGIIYLTLVTWIPSSSFCYVSKIMNRSDWLTGIVVFGLGALCVVLNRKSHRKQLGLFFAPKFLQALFGFLVIRGFVRDYDQLSQIMKGISLGLLAIACNLNNDSK